MSMAVKRFAAAPIADCHADFWYDLPRCIDELNSQLLTRPQLKVLSWTCWSDVDFFCLWHPAYRRNGKPYLSTCQRRQQIVAVLIGSDFLATFFPIRPDAPDDNSILDGFLIGT